MNNNKNIKEQQEINKETTTAESMNKIKEEKIKDLKFIKKFAKITIIDVCRTVGINKNNLWSGKSSAKTIKAIKEEIIKKVYALFEEYEIEKPKAEDQEENQKTDNEI